jgi:hypothetical protein
MPNLGPQVGNVARSNRDIPLVRNVHITMLSAGGAVLPKGTEAEITAVSPTH